MDNKQELKSIADKIIQLSENYFEIDNKEIPFIPGVSKIPVSGKVLDKKDLENLLLSSLDMWLTSGDFTDKFEKGLSKYLKIRHCLFVNSGSSANLLALSGLKVLYNLNDDDEVITSAVNFPTTVNPIIQNNLKPVFVDADKSSLNIDASLIESKITKRTKGIVLAHTLGNPFDIEKIASLCEKYNLFLMEDMCDALGSKYNKEYVGSFGDVATLSFYPAHHITTGEGGAVLTNNPKLKKILLSLRDWGRDCYCKPGEDNTCKKRYDWQLGGLPYGYDHKYIYSHIGYNFKATDMQASIGLSQLEKLEKFIKIRKKNYSFLKTGFSKFDCFDLLKVNNSSDVSWFGFPVIVNSKANFSRDDLLKFYEMHNIGTRLVFAGNILLQPAYVNLSNQDHNDFPVANDVVENAFWLGVFPGLTEEMLTYVLEVTSEFIKQNK